MLIYDIVSAKGHPNIKATHKITFEITKDDFLTPRGTCIIGIEADKSAKDLSPLLVKSLKSSTNIILVFLKTDTLCDLVIATGHEKLLLYDHRSIVIRKSDYIDGRTIAIKANKAARDINREIIKRLKKGCELKVYIFSIDPTLWNEAIIEVAEIIDMPTQILQRARRDSNPRLPG